MPTATHANTTALIIDDEPIARQRIRRLLLRDPEIDIIGEIASVAELEALPADSRPDLILLDVQLPQRDGFEMLKVLEARGITPLVIFVTAYSAYAVGAFEVEAVDYVLKPFDDERFAKAIARAKAQLAIERASAGMRTTPSNSDVAPRGQRLRDRLLVTEKGRVLFVPTREIELVQAAGKFVKIFTRGHCYLVRESLRDIEARLDANEFVRVHRSTIISVEQIVEVRPLFHGDYEVMLKRGTVVNLSRRFRPRMLPFMVGPWPV